MGCASKMENLSDLYNRDYYHGHAYDDYTFQKLRKGFLYKIRFVKKFCSEGSRLLDVGCALGYFVKIALDEGFDAYGTDFSHYAIEEARELVGNRVVRADVEKKIPFEDNYFDVVTAWDLLEHLKYPDLFIKRISRVLKKNGLIFLTTLNYNSLLSRILKERWPFIAPGYHQTHTITTTDIRIWLNEAGLKDIGMSTFGTVLRSFSRSFDSSISRKVVESIETALRFQTQIVLWLFRPLNMGDTISCVARRVR